MCPSILILQEFPMRRFVLAMLAAPLFPAAALAQTAPSPATPPAAGAPAAPGQSGGHWHGHWHHGDMMKIWQAKFAAANTTHDGHLTLAQAQAADLKPVVDHFAEIDTAHRGYVTFNDIVAWRMDRMAAKLEQKAAALRAQD
jgi:hypothetical protein